MTAPHHSPPSLAPWLRRRLIRVAVTTVVLTGLCGLLVGLGAVQRHLQPEMDATGATVANAVARDLARAVGYGIPMDRFTGMEAYLGRIVEDAPSVRAVAVLAADGRVLHSHGAGTAFAFHAVEAPLLVNGGEIGRVRVSLDRWLLLQGIAPTLGLVVAVTLLTMLAAAWLTGCLAVATVMEPLSAIGRTVIQGARGDFRRVPRVGGWGMARPLARGLAARIEVLRHEWLSLRENAMAARAAHFDPAVLSQIDSVVDDAARGYALPVEDVTRDNGLAARGAWQVVLFLLAAAEALCLPVVAQEPLLVALTWVPALLVSALPVGRWSPGGRTAIIGGGLVIALGQIAAVNAGAGAGMMAARLAVGIGYGIAFRGIAAMALQWRGLRAVSPGRHAVLTGVAVGPLLGGVLAAELSPSAPFIVAAMAAGSSLLVGRLLPPGIEGVRTGWSAAAALLPLALLMAAAAALLLAAQSQIAALLPGWSALVGGGALVSLLAGTGVAAARLFRRAQGITVVLPPLALATLGLVLAVAVLGGMAAVWAGGLLIGALLLSLILSLAARRKAPC